MLAFAIFISALAAFMVSAVSGGGAGLVMAPLLCLIVPVASVPAALSIGTAASSVSRIAIFRKSIRWDVVALFVPTALPASALGAWLLSLFNPVYVELIIGCFLLANLPALFRPARAEDSSAELNKKYLPFVGALAGFLSGFTGAVGLVFNGVYLRLGMSVSEIVVTRATNEILLHLLKICLYATFGFLTHAVVQAGALIAVAAILSSLVMRWILPLISQGLFRVIGRAAMVVAGATMLFLSTQHIAQLHEVWLSVSNTPEAREVEFYWKGKRILSAEASLPGHIELEWPVSFEMLSSDSQKLLLSVAPAKSLKTIEQVWSSRGWLYEVSYLKDGRTENATISVASD